MQNVLNKSKAAICFFSLMTLYIKSKDDSKIILTIVKHKGFVQIIELLNFCLNSDLKPIMHYFN